MNVQESIHYAFNKFFYDLVKDVKELTSSKEVEKTIKKEYKVRSNTTASNFERFDELLTDELYEKIISLTENDLLSDSFILNVEILKGLHLKDIIKSVPKDDQATVASYIYIFTLLVIVYRQPDDDTMRALFTSVMSALRNIQKGDDYNECLKDVYDDDVKTLIERANAVIKNTSSIKDEDVSGPSIDPLGGMGFLENTEIGNLAKEITNEINLEDLQIDKPEDLLNMNNSSIIGNIMGKVGSKLNEKMSKGEIKQEDLIKEAFSLMSNMQKSGNPLFNNPMTQAMMKNKGNVKIDESKLRSMSTKERLRKKHEEKYGK